MVRFVVSLTALLVLSAKVSALDFPPPGHGPQGPGRSPGMQMPMEDITKIKFEYTKEDKIFKDEAEVVVFQALYEKNKDAKVVTEFFLNLEKSKKLKMDEQRKSGERPDFEKMKQAMAQDKILMHKDLKAILEKLLPKKDVALCGDGKTPVVLEKATTDSMKETSKAVKLVLSEEEMAKIKQDLKAELKKELMSEMAKNKPREESGDKPRGSGPPERGSEKNQERPSSPMRLSGGGGSPPRGGGAGGSMGMNMYQQNPMMGQMEMMNQNSYGVQLMNFQNMNGGQQMQVGQQQMGQQQGQRMRPQFGNRQMGMGQMGYNYQMQNTRLNYGMNVNYTNSNMMYGNTNAMNYPYGQQQVNPFSAYNSFQYPMMTMGN